MMLIAAALVTMAVVVVVSEPFRLLMQLLWNDLEDLWFSVRRALF